MSKYIKLEDAINLFGRSGEYHADAIVDMLFFLPTIEVSEDAISREWVKGICEAMLDEEMLGHMLGYIEDAPSVIPKAQTNADQQVQRVEYVESDERSRCWNCEHFERMHETPISSDGTYYSCVTCNASECRYEPKDEPQTEREGEWIDTGIGKDEVYDEMYVCSKCGSVEFYSNFCPNCGARMKG